MYVYFYSFLLLLSTKKPFAEIERQNLPSIFFLSRTFLRISFYDQQHILVESGQLSEIIIMSGLIERSIIQWIKVWKRKLQLQSLVLSSLCSFGQNSQLFCDLLYASLY